MTHAHDKTYISSLGFDDPDKKDSVHDSACQYLTEKDNVLSLLKTFEFSGSEFDYNWVNTYLSHKELKYKIKSIFELPINQESGTFKRTIGFIDIYLNLTWTLTKIEEYQKYENNKWQTSTRLKEYFSNVAIEVKIKRTGIGDIIRQIKFYKGYADRKIDLRNFILATKFNITKREKEILLSENIYHIYLGETFDKYHDSKKDLKERAESLTL